MPARKSETSLRLRDLSALEERLGPGHRMCPGCTQPLAVRQVLMASPDPVIVVNATGCLEVATTIFPFTAWNVPYIHSAFENTGATASGVEAAVRALTRRGRFDGKVNVVAFAGDGGTADIGLQALSGAMERYHNFVYVCLDNEAYMNTGYQRSSATPMGAWTSTSPVGSARLGKRQRRKDLMEIAAAHAIPYAAQATPGFWRDLMQKAQKAFAAEGPAFLNVLVPCLTGWRFESHEAIEIGNLAVETLFWPLYEIENGVYRITRKVREPKPLEEFLGAQGRFRHLTRPEGAETLEALRADVQERYARLQMLEKATAEHAAAKEARAEVSA